MSGFESQRPETDLEGRLRNLILSNNAPNQGQPSNPTQQQGSKSFPSQPRNQAGPPVTRGTRNATPSGNNVAEIGLPVDASAKQGGRGVKKRPNQAQRRQMSSQFSIPIDNRQQQMPTTRHNYSPSGQYARPAQQYQRHMQSNSFASPSSYETHRHQPHSQGPWHGSSNSQSSFSSQHHRQSSQYQDPGSPQTGHPVSGYIYNHRQNQQFRPEEILAQASLLDELCFQVVTNSEIDRSEIAHKEAFRQRIEAISRDVILQYEQEHAQTQAQAFPSFSIELKCFGSLSSGFATKASDMDLGLLSPLSQPQPDMPGSPIPRLLEKAFLDAGLGARLLTRTRVPIIKLCENPPEKLRRDLLTEREKWDNGTENEPAEALEEDSHDHKAAACDEVGEHGETGVSNETTSSPETEFLVPGRGTAEPQRFYLKQGPNHTLAAYYGLAKRVLRKAGGRDVTISNYRELGDEDCEILTRVCQAFVQGLADVNLRQRLAQYPSLKFEPIYNTPTNRSLLGVLTQVEGEHVVMAWETRRVSERDQAQETHAEQLMRSWNKLQYKLAFGSDPVFYAKELQLLLDRIRKLASVQLITLEQGPHETPASYFARTVNIVNNLKPREGVAPSEMTEVLLAQYVSGINQDGLRSAVKDAVAASPARLDLKGVGQRHKSLHLAWELERALEKQLYDDSYVEDIKSYVFLLREPLRIVPGSDRHPEYVVPLSRQTIALASRIKSLPDPHQMTPNQPRDRYKDKLEFPKTGTGVQCDINFSAHLALQNTLLLRCYSHSDPRVRPMVLFVKHWAKVRGINSGYRGTLSSYGYVLMVLHYLVNVAQPFVCPNLQQLAPPPPPNPSPAEIDNSIICRGHNVQFWRNEEDIIRLAQANQLNHNSDSIGQLLRGFFEYYAQSGIMSTISGKGFDWGRDVLSLRTQGGLLTKQEKGWTGAKTVLEAQGGGANSQHAVPDQMQSGQPQGATGIPETDKAKLSSAPNKTGEMKEVRHRYLFAIEDPFELEHNVARTVTHNGIVSIRDEFRRAWRIVKSAGHGTLREDLLQDVNDVEENTAPFQRLLDEIHGSQLFDDAV